MRREEGGRGKEDETSIGSHGFRMAFAWFSHGQTCMMDMSVCRLCSYWSGKQKGDHSLNGVEEFN